MSAAATGGTVVINSASTRHSSMALDYEMGLVRVAASSAAFGNSATGFRVRPNDVTMIAPSAPNKIVRSCPSTPTGLKTAQGSLTGIVTKLNNKRSRVEIDEQPVNMDGKPLSEHDYSGDGSLAKSQTKLRNLLVAQLDLIKKQSDAIITKDRQLRELRQENRALQQRLLNLGQSSNTKTNLDGKKGCENIIVHENLLANGKPQNLSTIVTKDKAVETTQELLENYSTNLKTNNSSRNSYDNKICGQPNTSNDKSSSEIMHLFSNLETKIPYYTFHGEDFLEIEAKDIKQILSQAEVPAWRTVAIPTCYSMEGTENIEDETVLKRHSKPESDEKRRKRWDLQRMRQQKQVERLRARYDSTDLVTNSINHIPQKNMTKKVTHTTENVLDGISSVNSPSMALNPNFQNMNNYASVVTSTKECDWLTSLQPLPELATHVNVAEKIPVNAFGFCVPMLPKQGFSLPWLHESTKDKSGLRSKKCIPSKVVKNGKVSALSTSLQKRSKKGQVVKAASQKVISISNGHVNGVHKHHRVESMETFT